VLSGDKGERRRLQHSVRTADKYQRRDREARRGGDAHEDVALEKAEDDVPRVKQFTKVVLISVSRWSMCAVASECGVLQGRAPRLADFWTASALDSETLIERTEVD
jgi:hypothetical protein